jgi:ferredoxin
MAGQEQGMVARMIIIATFFSHFGAVRFKKQCDAAGWVARMKPVPRTLSSSCGTCVEYSPSLPGPDQPGSNHNSSNRAEADIAEESIQEADVRNMDETVWDCLPRDFSREEVEQAVEVTPEGYRWIYRAENN